MNRIQHNPLSFAARWAVIALIALNSFTSNAEDHSHHHHKSAAVLQVENAFATPTFALAKMGAGYFTLSNSSKEDVAITGVSVTKDVARTVEMHETYFEGELAKMRQLDMPFVIKAGETAEFVPQGKHLMIMGLSGPLETGNSFQVTLTFASGEMQVIDIPVMEKPGLKSGHHHHH